MLPGQDKPGPSKGSSDASPVIVPCGFRWLEVGTETIRKPQVAGSLPVAGSIPVQGFQELHERSAGLFVSPPQSTLNITVYADCNTLHRPTRHIFSFERHGRLLDVFR